MNLAEKLLRKLQDELLEALSVFAELLGPALAISGVSILVALIWAAILVTMLKH